MRRRAAEPPTRRRLRWPPPRRPRSGRRARQRRGDPVGIPDLAAARGHQRELRPAAGQLLAIQNHARTAEDGERLGRSAGHALVDRQPPRAVGREFRKRAVVRIVRGCDARAGLLPAAAIDRRRGSTRAGVLGAGFAGGVGAELHHHRIGRAGGAFVGALRRHAAAGQERQGANQTEVFEIAHVSNPPLQRRAS